MKSEINEKLRALRLEAGYTQKEMAKKISSTDKNVWAYEKGVATPPADVIVAYAEVFNVSTDYLLGLEDEFGIPVFTPEEKAAGISATKKISITPIEDEMLYVFREVGKMRGKPAQRAIIEMVEKML